jgi:hypothetical protein
LRIALTGWFLRAARVVVAGSGQRGGAERRDQAVIVETFTAFELERLLRLAK